MSIIEKFKIPSVPSLFINFMLIKFWWFYSYGNSSIFYFKFFDSLKDWHGHHHLVPQSAILFNKIIVKFTYFNGIKTTMLHCFYVYYVKPPHINTGNIMLTPIFGNTAFLNFLRHACIYVSWDILLTRWSM